MQIFAGLAGLFQQNSFQIIINDSVNVRVYKELWKKSGKSGKTWMFNLSKLGIDPKKELKNTVMMLDKNQKPFKIMLKFF